MKRINTSQAEKLDTLRKCRYFSNVSDQILSELSIGMQLCRFERGEAVFWEGDISKGLYIIQLGSVKLYKLSKQGREMILTVLRKAESFNEVTVFDHLPNPVNVAALEDSNIWIVDAESIRACLDKYPEVTQAVILNLSKNLRMLVEKLDELSFYQVTTRLARLIINLTEDELQGDSQVRLTRDDMAARLGTVREVVTRSLNELQRSKAIRVSRRKIKIANRERLREWAQIDQ
jgi:CRP/FNR family transcriptional regulator